MVLSADLPEHRYAGHDGGHAALMSVLATIRARGRVSRGEHHVEPVDHAQVRLEAGSFERGALERQRSWWWSRWRSASTIPVRAPRPADDAQSAGEAAPSRLARAPRWSAAAARAARRSRRTLARTPAV